MTLRFAEITDRGLVREKNEDALWSDGALFVIADGLGGLPRGEVASRTAVDAVVKAFQSLGPQIDPVWLREAFQKANDAIRSANPGAGRMDSMATTLTASWFYGNELHAAHVGDCRLYRVRDNQITRLTRDHSESRHGLTRAVGLDETLEVDFFSHKIQAGDAYLQASDGLYPLFSEEELAETVTGFSPADACREFVKVAKARGGPDNITLQIVQVGRIQV